MKKIIFAISAAALSTVCSMAPAQNFQYYVGKIPTYSTPLPVAADTSGNLYYATFNAGNSAVYYVPSPVTQIGTTNPAGTTVTASAAFPSGRGFQGLQVTSGGTVFASGDTGSAGVYIRKFGASPTFAEDTSFLTNVSANTNRIGGIAIVTEAGSGLLVASTFNSINYFKFDGTATGLSNVAGGTNYKREPIYNSTNNVIYSLKNGNSSPIMLDGYWSGISSTSGGGTWNGATMIPDGATSTTFGSSTQHGYYYAAANQLITCDSDLNSSSKARIRFWNITGSGATLTLSYAIDNTLGTPGWTYPADCVVIGTRLYVSVTMDNAIYVYSQTSGVTDWSLY